MKISSRQSRFSRKKFWILAVVLLVIGASIGAFYYFQNKRNSDPLNMPIDYASPTKEQNSAGVGAKEKAIERGNQNSSNSPATPEADLVTMETTYQKDSQQIIITTKLANSVSWDKCYLEVTQGATTKSFEARTVYQDNVSFCGGFSVPAQSMSGTWEVNLTVTDLNGKKYMENGSVAIN